MTLSVGDIALSKAGHDAGKRFVVLKIVDAQYVLIADGRTRKVAKPKRKKMRHLEWESSGSSVTEKLIAGETVTDRAIRAALSLKSGEE